MKHIETIKRYILCITGLFFLTMGITVCVKSGLGTSPVSVLPYILSCRFPLTMGEFAFIMHCVYLTVQIIILGKNFRHVQLLQLPLGIIFALFTDVTMNWLAFLQPQSFITELICLLCGCCLMGIGISFLVNARVIMIATEAMTLVIAEKCNKKFGNIKIIVDISAVLIGLVLSYLFFGAFFSHGIGLGTVISAFTVGNVVKIADKAIKPLTAHFTAQKAHPLCR